MKNQTLNIELAFLNLKEELMPLTLLYLLQTSKPLHFRCIVILFCCNFYYRVSGFKFKGERCNIYKRFVLCTYLHILYTILYYTILLYCIIHYLHQDCPPTSRGQRKRRTTIVSRACSVSRVC